MFHMISTKNITYKNLNELRTCPPRKKFFHVREREKEKQTPVTKSPGPNKEK
jgi:hypothetical protein